MLYIKIIWKTYVIYNKTQILFIFQALTLILSNNQDQKPNILYR